VPSVDIQFGTSQMQVNLSLLELACLLGHAVGCEQLTGGKVLMVLAYVCGL
jgi:hypothetical protein